MDREENTREVFRGLRIAYNTHKAREAFALLVCYGRPDCRRLDSN